MEREEQEKKNNEYLKQEAQKRIPDYIPFKNENSKNAFELGLIELNKKHQDYIESCPDDITCVENFIIIFDGGYSFKEESLLSDELRLDITNFLNTLPS
ncbi:MULTISPECIES: hypothetical protein [Flavobacteriaceae]|uniref:Uncharacterized protein n=2 Tax=Flavobacteriaceae TaxID=49546 RepID=A0A4Y8APY6_9FLAO|nr:MULTISPECIES: hypothetical protein [Flavobacteriaceae]TEW72628.1 hypothetical protein E2488_14370 [Gramella jeungdoensis]GGK54159.1 hypothetical protein GCM10007963_23060 [Lutibacter litoralis]